MTKKGRYDVLKQQNNPKDLHEYAQKYGLKYEYIEAAAQTLRKINGSLDNGPNIDQEFSKKYTRVRVGKLLVPRSFASHVTMICELMNIREEAFYQMIMMEGMMQYADKASGAIDLTNAAYAKENMRESSPDDKPDENIEPTVVPGDNTGA